MKAAINTKYGPPEVVEVKDIPQPKPKPNEVLIRIVYATVNRTDCGFRSAEYFVSRFFSGMFNPKYHTLGCEFSGIVEAVGNTVIKYQVGDKVFGFDDARFGAHAEFKIIPENGNMGHIPQNIDFETAGALSEGSHYGLFAIRAAKVQSGQKVLVNGGTGAIGSSAIQILKSMNANVTAVCGTAHIDKVKALGADVVIDYQKEDFTALPHQFDFVFDAVGKSSFKKCKAILKPNGIYISTELGKNGANVFLALFKPFIGSKKVLFPIPNMNPEVLAYLANLAEKGLFKPLIDRKYPLDKIVEAYKYVETGQKIGNVLIEM